MIFEYRQELIDNDRYFIAKSARETELNPVAGECVMCGNDIYENDTDYLLHENGTGICAKCLDKCHWG